jgi:hypothetical protein
MLSLSFLRNIGFAVLFFAATSASAQSSCSATNDNEDAECSISCAVGQSAECQKGTGSSTPVCECRGDVNSASAFKRAQILPFNSRLLAAASGSIERTDVLTNVNTKLASLKDYQLAESCQERAVGRICYREPCVHSNPSTSGLGTTKPTGIAPQGFANCPRRCDTEYKMVCTPVVGKLTAVAPVDVVGDPKVVITPPNWKDIPSSVLGYRETYVNCSSLQQTINFKHSESTRVGAKVSKQKTLSTTTKIDVKVDFNFFDLTKGELGVGFSQTVGVNDANEQSFEENRVLETNVPLAIAPMTRVVMDHYWLKREVPVAFSGTVVLDSPVQQNREGITRLSQVLVSESDRTFPFSGLIASTALAEGSTSVVETKLSQTQCSSTPGTFIRIPEPYSTIP